MAISNRSRIPAPPKAELSSRPAAAPAAPAPSVDAIALRAYQLWCESGCAHGHDQADWFRAERELRAGSRGR